MKYIFHKEYFISNENDNIQLGRHSVAVSFESNFSQKVLAMIYNTLDKPYVSIEGEEEVVVIKNSKIKSKSKKKKVKIDEPKTEQETSISTDTDSNEEES
jgi:hypothetical protein